MSNGQGQGRYSLVPASAYDDTRLTVRERDVLGCLGTYASPNGFWAIGHGEIAKRLGVERTTVTYALRKLAQLGYVEVRRRYRADGGKTTSAYRIRMDVEIPADAYRVLPDCIRDNPPHVIPEITWDVSPEITSHVSPEITSLTIPHSPSPNTVPSYAPVTSQRASARASVPSRARENGAAKAARTLDEYGWLETDPLYRAFIALTPIRPMTRRERGKWATGIKGLRDAGATPDDITARGTEYKNRWPKLAFNPAALENNWTDLEGTTHAQSEQLRRQAEETKRRLEAERSDEAWRIYREFEEKLNGEPVTVR